MIEALCELVGAQGGPAAVIAVPFAVVAVGAKTCNELMPVGEPLPLTGPTEAA